MNKGKKTVPGKYFYYWAFIYLASILFSGCSVSKHLQPDEKLYHQTNIIFDENAKIVSESQLKYNLEELSQPKPNSKLWLWVYYNFGKPDKTKGIGNFIRKRFGQPPVFYEQPDVDRNVLALKKYLIDQGYFSARVRYDTSQTDHQVDVTYYIDADGRHRIRNLYYPEDSSNIATLIKDIDGQTYLKSGEYYSLTKLVSERSRIAIEARNRGYFDFKDDRIFFFVDTNAVKKPDSLASDIWLEVKRPEKEADYKKYHIGRTYVYPNFDLAKSSAIQIQDSLIYKDLIIYQTNQIIRPKTLRSSIVQKLGDTFSEERQIATSNHLLDLGIYKFVNQKYKIREIGDTSFLDRYIYLTPGKVQNVGAALETTTRPGAFGVSIRGSYSHNNIFGGAERLDLSLATGFERGGKFAISDDTLSNNLREITARADLSIPRFLLPFGLGQNTSSFHVPRTRIGLLANYQDRPALFTLYNYRFTFGYDWDETRRKRHQVNLIAFNTLRIAGQSETFQRFLTENPLLQRSFSNLLILGSSYTYTLTNQEINRPRNYYFFLGQLEASGNSTYLLKRISSPKTEEPYRIFGREFSQFTKVDFDFRYNWLGKKSNLVTKISGGVGLAYSNSISLPIIKQYYAGGASSMRGFPIRSLLGSSSTSSSDVAQSSFDQTGDLKLEWNIEYRFDLWQDLYLKGAVFTDIGNVWKVNGIDYESDPKKVFAADRFLSELAVAGGFGVRVDIQYFVLRFDLGVPLKKPYLDKGNRWTFNKMGNSGWIRNNLIYNIALGYPF
ncbi:MAG: BamA/TamA family outer membrane protein [Saprospiraceae bacterium]|nr:BamA/TamA family outer membrane protein [Saprospiraceae bacterium]